MTQSAFDRRPLLTLVLVSALAVALILAGARAARLDAQSPAVMFVGTQTGAQPVLSTALATYPTSATATARNLIGAPVFEQSSKWSVVSTPAVSTQASASIAAEAGVRHVATTACFSGGSTTAPAATKLNINLRDGATGAGTILASWTVVALAATGQNVAPFCTPPLYVVGSTNTAMTLEYSALLTNLFEDVTLTGFNVQ